MKNKHSFTSFSKGQDFFIAFIIYRFIFGIIKNLKIVKKT